MGTMVRPYRGQKWTHKQFGGEFEVVEVGSNGNVRIARLDRPGLTIGMHEVQLHDHYTPLT